MGDQKLSIRQQLENYDQGKYNGKDIHTQIAAGWFDWFCKDTALAAKTPRFYNLLKKISSSPKIDVDKMTMFMRNQCPLSGTRYDSMSICDMQTGDVLFWMTPALGYKGADNGKAQLTVIKGNESENVVTGTVQDIVAWFMQGVSPKLPQKKPNDDLLKVAAVYYEFGIDIHGVPANLQPQVNAMARALIRARGK
jgi:hypothetical protein